MNHLKQFRSDTSQIIPVCFAILWYRPHNAPFPNQPPVSRLSATRAHITPQCSIWLSGFISWEQGWWRWWDWEAANHQTVCDNKTHNNLVGCWKIINVQTNIEKPNQNSISIRRPKQSNEIHSKHQDHIKTHNTSTAAEWRSSVVPSKWSSSITLLSHCKYENTWRNMFVIMLCSCTTISLCRHILKTKVQHWTLNNNFPQYSFHQQTIKRFPFNH